MIVFNTHNISLRMVFYYFHFMYEETKIQRAQYFAQIYTAIKGQKQDLNPLLPDFRSTFCWSKQDTRPAQISGMGQDTPPLVQKSSNSILQETLSGRHYSLGAIIVTIYNRKYSFPQLLFSESFLCSSLRILPTYYMLFGFLGLTGYSMAFSQYSQLLAK